MTARPEPLHPDIGPGGQDQSTEPASMGRLGIAAASAGLFSLLAAGGLLWWRDGEKLFTEGLISAIARCF